MRFILFLLVLTAFVSCSEGKSDEPVNKCATVDCEEWQSCVESTGTCALNEGRCEANTSCSETQQCNLTTHLCETKTNPCDGITCSGFGNCVIDNNIAKCNCNTGYHAEGLNCVIDVVDKCALVDCEEWQTCNSDNGVCELTIGRCVTNDDCDNNKSCNETHNCISEINECEGITCSSHGSCDVVNNSPVCNCNTGYHAEGLNCVVDVVDNCANVTCAEWESCNADNGLCQLKAGRCFTDANCDIEQHCNNDHYCINQTSPCTGILCSNNGLCVVQNEQPVCACNPGFTPSTHAGLDCVSTSQVCKSGAIVYDVDGDGINELLFEPSVDECYMFERINYTRATHDDEGTHECHFPLMYSVEWSAHARNHSKQMYERDDLFHEDFPNGQNCAYGCGVDCEMNMYMTGPSEPHCDELSHHCNIMRCWGGNYVGVGYYGGTWNTQNFY